MSEDRAPLVFLDANVLAKPVTRTLLIYASNRSDYRLTWSRYVEAEADRHLRPNQAAIRVAREAARLDLSPAGSGASNFTSTETSGRQVLADAVSAGSIPVPCKPIETHSLSSLCLPPMNLPLFSIEVIAACAVFNTAKPWFSVSVMAAGQ